MRAQKDLMDQLTSQLKKIDHDEQTVLLIEFLRQDEEIAQRFSENHPAR
jgi:hypothetical protein